MALGVRLIYEWYDRGVVLIELFEQRPHVPQLGLGNVFAKLRIQVRNLAFVIVAERLSLLEFRPKQINKSQLVLFESCH